MGIIPWDTKGDIVMAASKLEDGVLDLASIEILAMFWGLQLCVNMGIANIILENDSLLMVTEIQKATDSYAPQRVLVQETKRLICNSSENAKFNTLID